MIVKVYDILNAEVGFTTDQGLTVREAIGDSWLTEKIVLDFEGIRNVSPSFLSQAFFPLLLDTDVDKIDERLEFVNAPPVIDYPWKAILKSVRARQEREKGLRK